MLGVVFHAGERHLMRAERAFDRCAVDFFGTRPALGRAQHDHRPDRLFGESIRARFVLDGTDLGVARIECRGQELVNDQRFVPFDEIRFVAASDVKRLEILVARSRLYGRPGDLVAVEVQDR